jgi:TPR repeat protein
MLLTILLAALPTPGTRAQLLKRADRGEVRAEVQLSLSLQDLRQGPLDLAGSEHWLRVAAATGDAEGELYLGRLLHLVPGAHHDPAEALYWYKKAADQGNGWALNNLGLIYQGGDGIPANWKAAGGYFRASAGLGNSFGELNYADWLVDHPSVQKGSGRFTRWEIDIPQVLDSTGRPRPRENRTR